ncbi:MAG: DUF1330 domain-containing protein [Actinomycetota bacterium]|nr:DUF1330 domain-containing protein [Actinomycetota bacterium]
MPKAYVIADIDVRDPEAFARYRELSTSAAQRYGGRFVVRGGQATVLEGERQPARLVVLDPDDVRPPAGGGTRRSPRRRRSARRRRPAPSSSKECEPHTPGSPPPVHPSRGAARPSG